MATFYGEKESNILKTWLYLTIMSLFVVGVGWLISHQTGSYLFLWFAFLLSFFSSFYSYFYSDRLVLRMSKAGEVKKEDAPELFRIVENLSMAEGMPMPKIYILEESQPNAFATGRNPKNGVVAVTRGLMEMMSRAELEAVIAHELSHIKNRDVLLSTVLVVLASAVALLSRIFLRSAFLGGGNRREGGGGAITLVIALVVAILAPLVAMIMKLAVSRKREYLADSSAVLMTRHPQALADALQKIKDYPHGISVANDATAHLYIINPFRGQDAKKWIHKLFSTHPPLNDRIEKIKSVDV